MSRARSVLTPITLALLLAAGCAAGPGSSVPAAAAAPAASDAVIVEGAVPRPGSFDRTSLEALGAVTGTWRRREVDHTFRGVPLDAVLTACGFARGDMGAEVQKRDKAAGWKKVVLATATDGFQAVFSCAELMPAMGPTRAFLVWELDGAALDANAGPFRLLVPTDQEGSRSVHSVQTLRVVDLRESK